MGTESFSNLKKLEERSFAPVGNQTSQTAGLTLEITGIWDEARRATFAELSNGIAESRQSDPRSTLHKDVSSGGILGGGQRTG